MTQDEIIELGKQAGLCDKEGRDDNSIIITDHLERFAKLVEEKVHNRARAYLLKMHDDWLGEGTRGQA